MRRISFLVILFLGLNILVPNELIAANPVGWKLGNPAKELVIETSQDNSKQACGHTSGVFTIDISYIETARKTNGGAILDCWLDMKLPTTIVPKTTPLNFEKYAKSAYFEILVDGKWVPLSLNNNFDKSYNLDAWQYNSLRVNYYGPSDSVKKTCVNYKEKTLFQLRAASILKKQNKIIYSPAFRVEIVNHPQDWLQNCQISSNQNANTNNGVGDSGKRICTGSEIYNYNLIMYQIFYEMRFPSSNSQNKIAGYKEQGSIIEESCDRSKFDPLKMRNSANPCTTESKFNLIELATLIKTLNSQYKENLESQKQAVDKINFYQSTGQTNLATKIKTQYDGLLKDVQFIFSGREYLSSAFDALDSTCANSGITKPKI